MYGSWSAGSFGLVLGAIALVIALFFWAAPLIAVIIAVLLIPVFLVGMLLSRRRDEDQAEGPSAAQGAVTPEGQTTSPTGSRTRGAPASGEG
jgi:Flp pilus assembly protein TadB